jgi:hypothetical protein
LGGGVGVTRKVKLDLNLRLAQQTCGTNRRHARNQGELALERRCHRRCHGLGIGARQVRGDPNGRNFDLRHAGDRQQNIGNDTQQDEANHQQRRRDRADHEGSRNVHPKTPGSAAI